MAGTGLLLAFEAQILSWADRDSRRVEQPEGAPPASFERLLVAVAAQRGDLLVSSATVSRDSKEAVSLGLGREGVLYLDPYRQEVLGPGSVGVRRVFRGVTDLHRVLAASGPARSIGKAVTGASNLVFLCILASGLCLWVPRVCSRAQLRNAFWFRGGLTSKARDFSWHHVFGAWALVPLLLVVACALPISYEWAGNLVQRLGRPHSAAGRFAPANQPAAPRVAPVALSAMDLSGLDRVVARALSEVPGWRSITLRLPPPPDGIVHVSVDRGARRGRPDLRTQLAIDRANGEVVRHQPFAAQERGRRMRSWMRWIHTGEAGGLAGQTVGALACAATLMLGWTGYALAGRRFLAWRRRSARPDNAVSKFGVPPISPASDAATVATTGGLYREEV